MDTQPIPPLNNQVPPTATPVPPTATQPTYQPPVQPPVPQPVYQPPTPAPQTQPPQMPSPQTPIPPVIAPAPRKPKWLLVTLGAFVIIAGGAIGLSLGTINLVTNPSYDSVTINGQATTKTKVMKMPGTYEIEIIKDGYITYTKTIHLGFHGKFNLNQTLKANPTAEMITSNVAGPLNFSSTTDGLACSDTKTGNIIETLAAASDSELSFNTSNLNINPISGLQSVQFPDDMSIGLLSTISGYKILDLSKIQITSQLSKDLPSTISSATVSHNAEQIFYLQKDAKTGNNYIVRNNPGMTDQSIYFDQSLITQLGIVNPIFHYSYDDDYVLAVDGKIIYIDILGRSGTAIGDASNYVDARFNIGDQMVYAVNDSGELSTIAASDGSVINTGITTGINKVWPVNSEVAFILDNNGKFYSYNWANKTQTEYAIDQNYSQTISDVAIDINQKIVYFIANNQLYGQPLTRADYEADETFSTNEQGEGIE